MRISWQKYTWYILGVGFLGISIFTTIAITKNKTPNLTTETVVRGDITQVVAVSGFTEAKNVAELGFPRSGAVTAILADEGRTVEAGDIIATQGDSQLVAERLVATAALTEAVALKQELLAGATGEIRAVASAKVTAAKNSLDATIATEAAKVASARAALLSNDLEALSNDSTETATPPTISGTYNCDTEGTYTLSVYRSNSDSGYSYTTTGLESVSGSATTDQPSALGTCGLYIQFSSNVAYGDTDWTVKIPNTRSTTYTTFKNTLDVARTAQTQAVEAATNAYTIATQENSQTTAGARTTEINRADAAISAAQARIASIDAQIADLSIVAPFAGTITDISVTRGEVVGTNPVITILGDNAFTLTARIPEIDITKVIAEQRVKVTFDANPSQPQDGIISFLSPLPTLIDGVAYFEATITLEQTPPWLRAGLNADVDITTSETANALKIPARYITTKGDASTVLTLPNDSRQPVAVPVTILFSGTDGYVAVEGIPEGTIVVIPQP